MRKPVSEDPWFQVARTAVAALLAIGFLGLLSTITAFGIFTGSREVVLGVLKIVAYGIVFSCAWAGGASLQRRDRKKNGFRKSFQQLGRIGAALPYWKM